MVEETLKAVGEWLAKRTTIYSSMGCARTDMMVITLSPEFANRAIQNMKQGKFPG